LCVKGAACKFSHDPASVAQTIINQENWETPTCWYYEKGMCSKATGCPFQHVGDVPQGKMPRTEREEPDDDIYTAVKVALTAAVVIEGENNVQRMRQKISKYCHDSLQGLMKVAGPAKALIDEYADSLFSKIYAGFGDRPWLQQMDFLLVLDAAVKELLPKPVMTTVSFEDIETFIFQAHDRALDEQRCLPITWDTVQQVVQGPKTRKRVYAAVEIGRKAAVNKEDVFGAEDFARTWITTALIALRKDCGGYPEQVLDTTTATNMFVSLFEGGALPEARMAEGWPAVTGWKPFVQEVVKEAYTPAVQASPTGHIPIPRATFAAAYPPFGE